MAHSVSMEKIINILAAMVAAINNIRLYPASSAPIINSIDKAYNAIQNAITSNSPLLIAESESNLLISGEPLSFRNQQFPQVTTFKSIMTTLRIKSIIIKKEMTREAFETFLNIMSKTNEDVDLEGGIKKVVAQAKMENISITPALFVPESGEMADSSLDSSDYDLIKSFLGERRILEADYMRMGEKAADSNWVGEFFKAAIQLIKSQGINLSDNLLPETISKMVNAFGKSTPRENWSRVSASITRALGESDPELMTVVMAKNQEGNLFDTLVKTLSDEQYINFFSEINRINESGSYGNKPLTENESRQFLSTLSALKKNKKTQNLKIKIKDKILSEKKKRALDKVHQQKGFNKIAQGDLSPLEDTLIMEAVPEQISAWFGSGKEDSARSLINKIADGLLNESLKTRSLASSALLAMAERFTAEDNQAELTRLVDRLNVWVKFETEVTYNYKAACQLLQKHCRALLTQYKFPEANAILETFSFIHYGRLEKNDEIKELAGNILRDVGSEKFFALIFEEFQANKHDQGKNAFYTLIRLGSISVEPLLDLLRTSEDMSQRVRIINAITEIGQPALAAIVERLQVGNSWFYMRNLIKLLSELGSEEHIKILTPLLKHKNDVIPKAVMNCAFDIGGKERVRFLNNALAELPTDQLKSMAADLLGKTGSEEAVFPLTQALKAKPMESAEAKNDLDLTICAALKRIGSKKAIPALTSIVKQKGILGLSSYGPDLRNAASATLKLLQSLPSKQERADAEKEALEAAKRKSRPTNAKTVEMLVADPQRAEALLEEYVRQKNIPEAVRLLYRLIVKFAREKNFPKAEELREKLYHIDPMALSEIVKTGDIIEEEKNNAVINDYMNIWGNLYEQLTNDEANALFFNIKAEEYQPDETVIAQKEMNSRLYFINRGQLKIVYTVGGNEFFLKMLGAGDVAGEDTFFNITISTASVVTLSHVKVGYLERDTLTNLGKKFPDLERKLEDFCIYGDGINSLVKKSGLERRQEKRFPITGKALIQLLDTAGKTLGKPFKGDLMDISMGGLSIKIKTAKKETARLLLGRKINMAIGVKSENEPVELSRVGTIIGVKQQKDVQFSLHLRIDSPIDEHTMIEISSLSGKY